MDKYGILHSVWLFSYSTVQTYVVVHIGIVSWRQFQCLPTTYVCGKKVRKKLSGYPSPQALRPINITLVNVYVDLVIFTRIAGSS